MAGLRSFLASRSGIAALVFLAIAGFFLWTEHRAHLLGLLPYLLLLACPLMHLFHHGGHKHGGHAASDKGAGDRP
jgi:hypothetical protein